MAAVDEKITVLIVDDSSLSRRSLRAIFEAERDFLVVGEASTGRDGVRLARELEPRLVTMDLDMPGGNGLDATADIMAYSPTRILVVTGVPRFEGLDASFEALSRGALDLIPKPTAWPATPAERERLLTTARRLARIPVLLHARAAREKRHRDQHQEVLPERRGEGRSVVVIGASTGGPRVLASLLRALPSGFPLPILIVQHLADAFAGGFINWLDSHTRLDVVEALSGIPLVAGRVFVAVRGAHVIVTSRRWIEASHLPPRDGYCPSIDVLFESAARVCGSGTVGVLLTGMGRDGAAGLKTIADAGGVTIAQDEASSAVFGMPAEAIALGAVQHVVAMEDLASSLMRIAGCGAEDRREVCE